MPQGQMMQQMPQQMPQGQMMQQMPQQGQMMQQMPQGQMMQQMPQGQMMQQMPQQGQMMQGQVPATGYPPGYDGSNIIATNYATQGGYPQQQMQGNNMYAQY
jgi:hypothetical protein